jgi:F0F1-type ATP synthase assembly protein I
MLPSNRRPDVVRYTTAGIEFTLTFGLPLAGGLWLDRRLNTIPGFSLLGGAVGFAVGLYRLLRQARRLRDQEEASRHERRD